MNRRNFIASLVAFSILPAATTYARKWIKPQESKIYQVNPEWVNAKCEVRFLAYPLQQPNDFIIPIIYKRPITPPELVNFNPDDYVGEYAS